MALGISQGTIFTLFSVNLEQCRQKYNAGYYSTAEMPKIKKISSDKTNRNIDKVLSESPDADIFAVKNRSGTGSLIACDGCTAYNNFSNGEKITIRCNYCRRDFLIERPFHVIIDIHNDDFSQKSEIKSLPGSNLHKMNLGDRVVFGADQCCSRSCAYGLALENGNKDTIYYTRTFYSDGEDLLPPKSWRLLKVNGGSLTDEEWDDPTYKYTLQPSFIYPVKRTYEKGLV